MKISRYKELTEDGPIIHAGPSDGNDTTLCGYALEGESDGHRGDETPVAVHRGKINCPTCVNIIRVCKAVPARLYDKSAGDRYNHD